MNTTSEISNPPLTDSLLASIFPRQYFPPGSIELTGTYEQGVSDGRVDAQRLFDGDANPRYYPAPEVNPVLELRTPEEHTAVHEWLHASEQGRCHYVAIKAKHQMAECVTDPTPYQIGYAAGFDARSEELRVAFPDRFQDHNE